MSKQTAQLLEAFEALPEEEKRVGIERNVLGRRGWLDRIRFGLVDYDQAVYLAAYGEGS